MIFGLIISTGDSTYYISLKPKNEDGILNAECLKALK
jgi:hypothetical protein